MSTGSKTFKIGDKVTFHPTGLETFVRRGGEITEINEHTCVVVDAEGEAYTLGYLGNEVRKIGTTPFVEAKAPPAPTTKAAPQYQEKNCRKCGDDFYPAGPRQKYCPTCQVVRADKPVTRVCQADGCGSDISDRSPTAKYCQACAGKRKRQCKLAYSRKHSRPSTRRQTTTHAPGVPQNPTLTPSTPPVDAVAPVPVETASSPRVDIVAVLLAEAQRLEELAAVVRKAAGIIKSERQ